MLAFMIVVVCGCSSNKKTDSGIPASALPPGPGESIKTAPEVTLENIGKLSDDDLEGAITAQVLGKVNYNAPTEKEKIAGMSDGEKIVYLTTTLEGEVYNGGFHQYFCNTNGELAVDTVEAYTKIGAKKHAELMAKAIELAAKEEGLRESIKTSKDQLKAFVSSYKETKLEKLDDIFYDLEEKEEPRTLRVAYIRKHASEFINPASR